MVLAHCLGYQILLYVELVLQVLEIQGVLQEQLVIGTAWFAAGSGRLSGQERVAGLGLESLVLVLRLVVEVGSEDLLRWLEVQVYRRAVYGHACKRCVLAS